MKNPVFPISKRWFGQSMIGSWKWMGCSSKQKGDTNGTHARVCQSRRIQRSLASNEGHSPQAGRGEKTLRKGEEIKKEEGPQAGLWENPLGEIEKKSEFYHQSLNEPEQY